MGKRLSQIDLAVLALGVAEEGFISRIRQDRLNVAFRASLVIRDRRDEEGFPLALDLGVFRIETEFFRDDHGLRAFMFKYGGSHLPKICIRRQLLGQEAGSYPSSYRDLMI